MIRKKKKQNLGAIDRSCARMPVQKSKFKQRTIEKIKIKKKKRKSVHKDVRIIFIQFKSHSPFGRSGAGLRRP